MGWLGKSDSLLSYCRLTCKYAFYRIKTNAKGEYKTYRYGHYIRRSKEGRLARKGVVWLSKGKFSTMLRTEFGKKLALIHLKVGIPKFANNFLCQTRKYI